MRWPLVIFVMRILAINSDYAQNAPTTYSWPVQIMSKDNEFLQVSEKRQNMNNNNNSGLLLDERATPETNTASGFDAPSSANRPPSQQNRPTIRMPYSRHSFSGTGTGTSSGNTLAQLYQRQVSADQNTVANYDLCEAHTVLEDNTVVEAAKHMVAKHLDFALVVDTMGRLVGIVTAKDLAFRAVACCLNLRRSSVAEIMTREPVCVQSSTGILDALRMMTENRFRHLPVLDDDRIVGVLDIAKCLYDALLKVELADAAASQIASALECVGKELVGVMEAGVSKGRAALSYASDIRDALASPSIGSMIEVNYVGRPSLKVKTDANVLHTIQQMKDDGATGVLVTDDEAGLTLQGIFTTKDILQRVIAHGLDASNLFIGQVMTPNPDYITTKLSVVSALRQMHNGQYLHLPVLTGDGQKTVVGIIDVLQITYVILDQLSELNNGGKRGTLWNELWSSHKSDSLPVPRQRSDYRRDSLISQATVSALSDQRSHLHVSKAPSIVDEFTIPTAIVFKIKYGNEAMLITAENALHLPKLSELLAESLSRFELEKGTLNFIDDEDDLIPIRSDAELSKFCNLASIGGKDRINLALTSKTNEKPAIRELTPAVGTALIIAGAFLGLLLFRLRIDS